MPSRIQILTWRQHGDDDDSTTIAVYGADDSTNALADVKREYDIGLTDDEGKELPDGYDAEAAEDWSNVIYIDNDAEILDGDILTHNGRSFRINITEVPTDQKEVEGTKRA